MLKKGGLINIFVTGLNGGEPQGIKYSFPFKNQTQWTEQNLRSILIKFCLTKKYEKKDFKNKKYYYCFCDGSTDSAKIQKNWIYITNAYSGI